MATASKRTPVKKSKEVTAALPFKKSNANKLTDADKVKEYMDKLEHPLKAEIEEVRTIIKGADKKISERIKWKAPSYYYKEDMVTFNGWATKNVHLVFHHPAIIKIKSTLLEGDYPTRRMAYFTDMADVQKKKKELEKVVKQLVKLIDKK
jgi:hypothetical protein